MESREKPDSYGEWAIRRVQQEAGEGGNVLPAEVITTARVVWPRAVAVVASELNREGSGREAETLAAEIWEGVLRSVAKALPRQYGYSWKAIAIWSGLSEQAAKKKFEYGLEKTRHRIVRLLKSERPKESA